MFSLLLFGLRLVNILSLKCEGGFIVLVLDLDCVGVFIFEDGTAALEAGEVFDIIVLFVSSESNV